MSTTPNDGGTSGLPAPDVGGYSAAVRTVKVGIGWFDAAGASLWIQQASFWISEPPDSPSVQVCTETKIPPATNFGGPAQVIDS